MNSKSSDSGTNVPEYDIGVIHGRFQVLHSDHLKYILAGKRLCRHLIIGITNPEPLMNKEEDTDTQRSSILANPLNYYERYTLVRTALYDSGIRAREFSVVPFPINMTEKYQYYVPLDAVFFLTIYDDWGRKKQNYFESMGLTIHILWEKPLEQKGISGHEVRSRMINNVPWEHMVPPGVAYFLTQWNIPRRLKNLQENTK